MRSLVLARDGDVNALPPRAISSRSMIVFARPSNDQPCSWVTTTGTPQSRPITTPQTLEPNLWACITSIAFLAQQPVPAAAKRQT